MNHLSLEKNEQLEVESLKILLYVYEKLSKEKNTPPPIDILYQVFRERWISEIHDFVTVNADSLEISTTENGMKLLDITTSNVLEKLAEWGYPIPSQLKIHNVLNALGLSYISNRNEIINCSVVEVW